MVLLSGFVKFSVIYRVPPLSIFFRKNNKWKYPLVIIDGINEVGI